MTFLPTGNFFLKYSKLKNIIKLLSLSLIVFLVSRVLFFNIAKIDLMAINLNLGWIFLAFFLEIFIRALTGFIWKLILASFSSKIPLTYCVTVSFISLLGKYIPGRIASIVSIIYLFSKYKVRKIISIFVPILYNVITVGSAFILCFPFWISSYFKKIIDFSFLGMAAISICALFFLRPNFLIRLSNIILKKFNRHEIVAETNHSTLLLAIILIFFQCTLAGFSLWLVLGSIQHLKIDLLPIVVSIGITANIVGVLVFFSPAGLGVREGVYLLLLTPLIGGELAALSGVLLRIITTCVDFSLGNIALMLIKYQNMSTS